MRKFATYIILSATAVHAFARSAQEEIKTDDGRFYYKELNWAGNMYQHSSNPVSLSYNRIGTVSEAAFNTHFERGKLHRLDKSDRHNDFSMHIAGLQRFGRLNVSGTMSYTDTKEYNRRWNSTPYLTEKNPFVLCDSIASDVTAEQFTMSAGASYRLNGAFTGALALRYLTGSSADQTDPRPRVNAMRFGLNPGGEFRIGQRQAVGISADIEIFRSEITHAIVNPNNNYVYFLMKGMGDYQVRTNNDVTAYPRDYKGEKYKGAVQWLLNSSERISNILEISFAASNEEATDGGSTYTFKGGDYHHRKVAVYDRFSFGRGASVRHNLGVNVAYTTDEGVWYDQKKRTDTEHGNLVYYEILNKSKIRKGGYWDVSASYRSDFFKDGLPDVTLQASAGLEKADTKQYEVAVFRQKYQLVKLQVEGSKHWRTGRYRLQGLVSGLYVTNVGDKTFSSVKKNLSVTYSAPMFEYASAGKCHVHAGFSVHSPVRIYNYGTWIGLYGNVSYSFYNDHSRYTDKYRSTSMMTVDVGVNLKF